MIVKVWFVLLLLPFVLSCNSSGKVKVVSVNNQTLYQSDIDVLAGESLNDEDLREQIVVDWVETQLGLSFWDSLSKAEKQSVDYKVAEYKAQLIRFELENRWIAKAVDTNVTEQALKEFYDAHIDEFLLNDYIVKILYLKVPVLAPDIDVLNVLYLLKDGSDTSKIANYANQYAAAFYFNKDTWISFEEFLKELPLDLGSVERFVTNKSKKIIEHNGFFYYINVLDYRLKNTPSPFSYERDRIRTRIVLNRKLELREKAKEHYELKLKTNDEVKYYNR
jgi:hypothetical protein